MDATRLLVRCESHPTMLFLISINRFNFLGAQPNRTKYTYDVFNRLIRRKLDADGSGGGAATNTFYIGHDGITPTLEFDNTTKDDVSHRYLWGPINDQLFADEQVTTTSSDGNTLWALADHLGTIRDIADYDAGSSTFSITNHRVYDTFGKLESETGSSVDLMFGYTGKQFDEDTKMNNYLNRWYDSRIGKWLSDDPLGFAAGDTNLARYVGNTSSMMIDPLGLTGGFGVDGSATHTSTGQDVGNDAVEAIEEAGIYDLVEKFYKEDLPTLDGNLDRYDCDNAATHAYNVLRRKYEGQKGVTVQLVDFNWKIDGKKGDGHVVVVVDRKLPDGSIERFWVDAVKKGFVKRTTPKGPTGEENREDAKELMFKTGLLRPEDRDKTDVVDMDFPYTPSSYHAKHYEWEPRKKDTALWEKIYKHLRKNKKPDPDTGKEITDEFIEEFKKNK